MESLVGPVHRISDVFARRMPIRINTGRKLSVSLCIEELALSTDGHHRGSVSASDMQAGRIGVRLIESMAIDAGGRHLSILKQRSLAKRRKFALINTHLAVYFVSRRKQAVHQSVINGKRADIERERPIRFPFSVLTDTYFHFKAVPFIVLQQLAPFSGRDLHRFSACPDGISFLSDNHDIYRLRPIGSHTEVERCNGSGNRYPRIVGPYRRKCIYRNGRYHLLPAGNHR